MPELPEVETIRRGLSPLLKGKKIERVEIDETMQKAFRGERAEVEGATVVDLRRRGKALLIDLDNGTTMMIHLRMTGQLIWRSDEFSLRTTSLDSPVRGRGMSNTAPLRASNLPRISSEITASDIFEHQFAAGHPSKNFTAELPNGQTRVTFEFGDGALYFNDQRKFGFVKVLPTEEVEQDEFIAGLAKEPWEMSAGELYERCQRHKKAPIKAVLLDQKVIAGLGNIYADESLFYAGVHPATRAGELTEEQVGKILEGACKVMMESIDSGGSTMATYVKPDGTTGSYLENFAQVFRREGKECLRCGAIIEKTRVAGRGTHFCPRCQVLARSEDVSLEARPRRPSLRGRGAHAPRKSASSRETLQTEPTPDSADACDTLAKQTKLDSEIVE